MSRRFLLLACLVLGSCRGESLPPGASDPIIIGAVLPLSGDGLEGDGPYYEAAMRLAVREINAAGGPIPGRRVELRVADGAGNPTTAVSETRRLIDEGAVAILGDAASSNSLAIYQMVTRDARIPQLSCTSTSTLLTNANADVSAANRFFFRTAPSDRFQAQVVVDAAMTEGMCGNRIAMLYQNDDYGRPLAQAVEQLIATRLGASALVANVSFMPGTTMFTSQVATVSTAMPNCIVLVAYPPAAGDIVREWVAASGPSTTRWIGTDALNTPALPMEAGSPAAVNGWLGTAPQTVATTPQFNAFRSRLEGVYGEPPQAFQSNCYDAAALLMLAIAHAGSTDGTDIRDALLRLNVLADSERIDAASLDQGLARIFMSRPINYEGASGPVDFDETGDVVADYVIWRFNAATSEFVTVRTVRPARMPL